MEVKVLLGSTKRNLFYGVNSVYKSNTGDKDWLIVIYDLNIEEERRQII